MSLKSILKVPITIKWYSLSLFICILGLGIGDTYFSIYIEYILKFGLGVSIFGAIYPFTKLFIVSSVGILNNRGKSEELIFLGKIFRIISGIFYFLAGILKSRIILLLGIIFSGIAGACIYPSYWTLYKRLSNNKNQGKIFGYNISSINLGYCFGALICAIIIIHIDLPYIFLFMTLFITISLIIDKKITNLSSIKKNNSSKIGTLKLLFKNLYSIKPLKETRSILKEYKGTMYSALGAQALINLMEYVSFLFIPIISSANNLNLTQIAIITTIMWFPNILNIFAGSLSDKYNKKLLIGILLLIGGIFYILLGFNNSFIAILSITFGIAFIMAFIFPIVSALISEEIKKDEEGTIAGVKEFIATCGEILGSLGFGVFISILGIQTAFIFFGLLLSFLAIYIIIKKIAVK